jgi:Uma2 family endonuclease
MEAYDMAVNAPARPYSGTMDVDDFMVFLETRPKEERWHLIEGIAVMMAPSSLAHQRIALNLCELLNRGLVAQRLDLYAYHEIAIRLPGVLNFQPEPDVVVAPSPVGYELYAQDLRLVAEILPPSHARTEIDMKLRRYREAPGNLYAVVIEPREYLVEVYAKSRNWQPLILKQAADPIEMPEFGLRCTVGDLYRGTPLDPHRGDLS